MRKKILSAAAIGLFVFAASCLKDDNTSTKPRYQDPSLEINTIDSFTNAMGYTDMVYDPALLGFKYEIIERGDTTNGLISSVNPIGSVTYIGKKMNGIAFDSSYKNTDSITKMDIYNAASYGRLIYSWAYVFINRAVPAKIGKGGHIRFVTPSAYAYGSSGNSVIPANSPLFFDVYLKDVSSN